MTKAEKFIEQYGKEACLYKKALDFKEVIDEEQDYENEITTWYFDDGSHIKIQNECVETGVN